MRRRSFAARVIGLGLFMSAPAGLQAQTSRPDLSTLMRTQILDIWLSRTPDGSRILIDPPATDLRTLSPFTLVTQIEQQIGSQLSSLPIGSSSGGFTSVVSPGDPGHGIPPVTSEAFATVEPQNGTLRSILGTSGLKFNPTGSILISAHVIATISDAGLRQSLTPVPGFDYSF